MHKQQKGKFKTGKNLFCLLGSLPKPDRPVRRSHLGGGPAEAEPVTQVVDAMGELGRREHLLRFSGFVEVHADLVF